MRKALIILIFATTCSVALAKDLTIISNTSGLASVIGFGTVPGDRPIDIGVLVDNLVRNAWKFTSKHAAARIEFGQRQQDGETVFFIKDDGAGFDMEYANKLFLPFQRLHPTGEFEGSGIGLATVRRIVQRHGGRIWAEGEVEKGATIFFTLKGGGSVENA